MIATIVGAACPLVFAIAVLAICVLLHRDRRRTAMAMTPCRSCRTPKPSRIYLCAGCWDSLTAATRRALNRRDSKALARLRELHQQIDAGVPLAAIRVTP